MAKSGYSPLQHGGETFEMHSRQSIDISSCGPSALDVGSYKDNISVQQISCPDTGFQPLMSHSSPSPRPSFVKRLSGWRVGVAACAITAFTALLLNVSITVAIATRFGVPGGIGTLYTGSCRKVEAINFWAHLGINALSTILLSGSNYCMQCLSSPTRDEVDSAHAKGRWLDIGAPSVRNLKSIAWKRVLLWWMLGLSSVPLHLMYNSAVFSTLGSNSYVYLRVAPDFASTPPWTTESLQMTPNASYALEIQKNSPSYSKLSPAECIKTYSNAILPTRRNLILVLAENATIQHSGLLSYDEYDSPTSNSTSSAFSWMCNDTMLSGHSSPILRTTCAGQISKIAATPDEWYPQYATAKVDHCLSEAVPELCSLQFSLTIMLVVIVCNLVKTVVMTVVAFKLVWSPLITIGDGIASFVATPDKHTKGFCLLSAPRAKQQTWKANQVMWRLSSIYSPTVASEWMVEKRRWAQSASFRRWFTCNALCIANLVVSIGLMNFGIEQISSNFGVQENLKSLWKLGFGSVNQLTIINWTLVSSGSAGLLANTFVANLPQSILSFLYLTFNGLCTCMFVAREWSQFAKIRKPLRVSMPTGRQRSTYFLQLPYRYSIPFVVLSGALHWFVSQSLFLANVDSYDINGIKDDSRSFSTCGYSPISMVFVIIFGVVLILTGASLGMRRIEPGMPFVATCSAAISAACHIPDDELKLRPELQPLQWGVIPGMVDEFGNSHCSFSTRDVLQPQDDGTLYAGKP